jgi:predicted regulator of Ras-like GTPase activity (Roadblock/LC7/MglB family)
MPGFSLVNGDTSSDATGYENSIAIGIDGLPVISYRDTTHGYLRVLHCGDITCSTGNTMTNVDTSGGLAAYQTSLAIGADGLPVISYFALPTNDDLKIAHCGNVACTSGNTITSVDTAGKVGMYSALTIGVDGLPIISYQDNTSSPFHLKVLHCGNVDCTAGNVFTLVDPGSGSESFGYGTSITIGMDGLPVISYKNNFSDLKVAHCGDIHCASGNTITKVDNRDSLYTTSITTGADGLPVIAYIADSGFNLKVLHCGNSACTSANTINTVDSDAYNASITIGTDGLPIISYMDWTSKDLKVAHCGDVSCSLGNAIYTLELANQSGERSSITIGVDGLPIISYLDLTTYKLRVAHCSNTFCMPYWRRR